MAELSQADSSSSSSATSSLASSSTSLVVGWMYSGMGDSGSLFHFVTSNSFLVGFACGQMVLILGFAVGVWLLLLKIGAKTVEQIQNGPNTSSFSNGIPPIKSNLSAGKNQASDNSFDNPALPLKIRISKQSEHAFFEEFHAKSFQNKPASPETCLWLNVLVARLFHDVTRSDRVMQKMLSALDQALNNPNNPPFMGPVNIHELILSDAIPIIESVNIDAKYDPNGVEPLDINATFDLEYKGHINLTCDTELVLNWPIDKLASLPVCVTLNLSELKAKVRLHLPCPNKTSIENSGFSFAFVEPPHYVFSAESSLGNSVQLSSEKLASIISRNIRAALMKRCVLPAQIKFHLFSDDESEREPGQDSSADSPDEPPNTAGENGVKESKFKNKLNNDDSSAKNKSKLKVL